MEKNRNKGELKQGLKARDWFLCAHCKKDYKPARGSGAMTCPGCRKKGLKDEDAVKVAEELSGMKKQDKEEYDAYEDTEFIFDFNMRRLSPELLRNKKLRKLLKTYSSLYESTHAKANLQNTIVADFSEKKISEELGDKDKDRLINTILTGIQARQIKAGIIVIHTGLAPEQIAVLKEKAANKMPDAMLHFFVVNKKHAGHTLIDAMLFGNFPFLPEDGCC
ncbi:hypothetical protein HYV82_04510 [Candidatus Woesearchaeota archaeon]|nr:hypothetical protein [Candidatus Woesearchaeota archaeon]